MLECKRQGFQSVFLVLKDFIAILSEVQQLKKRIKACFR